MRKLKCYLTLLIIILGMIGGAYALWTDHLVVSGTAATGEMNMEWSNFYLRLPGTGHSATPLPAYVTAEAYIDPNDKQRAVLTIDNLYPMANSPAWHEGDRVAVTGYMENKGTIPVKFDGAEISFSENQNDVAEWMRADVRIAKRISGSWTVLHTQAAVPLKELESAFDSVEGTELGIGDLLGFGDETLYIYLDEDAPNEVQDSRLEFTFKLNFIQWNLY